ncbi:hypothetical protein D3C72_2100450 [compost metagenome]
MKAARPTGRVKRESEWVTTSGHKKAFQAVTKVKMPRLASAGAESGSATRQKVPHGPSPSIRAASSSSVGKARKLWRIRKMPKAPTSPGRISAA